ncbi:MAG TPA: hypothetical protein VHY91_05580 [Pirellulales bacterium]|jgi:hypothetical protein|nr:hypothetical protein [Pirellulales bacterium]
MFRSAWIWVVAAAVFATNGACANAVRADEAAASAAMSKPAATKPVAATKPLATKPTARNAAVQKPAAPAAGIDAGPEKFRSLAPGVEITIAPDEQEDETTSTHDIVEILNGIPDLKWTPKTEPTTQTLSQLATGTVFRRDIWCLEFTFKPVRMLWVDVPQPSGKMQRKLIWYLLYHVTNRGQHLHPKRGEDGAYEITRVDSDVRFIPQFVLESQEYKKSYLDRVIPVAIEEIRKKEDPNRQLLNSVEISAAKIPVSSDGLDRPVWGVATWEDVDSRIDYFSISIEGLTNAYLWTDRPEAFHPGDPPGKGRTLTEKTLVLNFWRPGDEFVEDQRFIRYGMPGKVDYSWVYR